MKIDLDDRIYKAVQILIGECKVKEDVEQRIGTIVIVYVYQHKDYFSPETFARLWELCKSYDRQLSKDNPNRIAISQFIKED